MTKVMIFGGRDFNNYNLLCKVCDKLLSRFNNITIVEGEASGADTLARRYGEEKGYIIEKYPADWNNLEAPICSIKYNRYGEPYNCLAGFNRNQTMVDVCDIAIGFWDSKSSGTYDSMKRLKKANKKTVIVDYVKNKAYQWVK